MFLNCTVVWTEDSARLLLNREEDRNGLQEGHESTSWRSLDIRVMQ